MREYKIGIPCWSLGENAFGVTKNYISYGQKFGKVVLLLPNREIDPTLDLIILPGGMDVNPFMYDEAPSVYTTSTDVFKQYFVDQNLPLYIKAGIAVAGICLGFQQLAAYFGMPIEQHLLWHAQSSERYKEGHKVSITKAGDEFLFKDDRRRKLPVNSHHHQGLLLSSLVDYGGGEFIPLALADCEDNVTEQIVEAFIHKTLPVCGMQFHAEELSFDGGSQWFADSMIRKVLFESRVTRGLDVEEEKQESSLVS
jgi:gamma-glutamyl-gamma-aminobutyrate hydrolase PuuD